MSIESAFSSDEVQLVTFVVGQESFALDINSVQEVIRMPDITRIPGAPDYVAGMTNLRGHILAVIDTRTKFGMEKGEASESNRVIVIDMGGAAVGLNVDAVSEVLRTEGRNIEQAPPTLSVNVDSGSITGVVKLDSGKKLVMVLDAGALFGREEFQKGSSRQIGTENRASDALSDEMQIVSFQVGQEEFGLEIAKVKEIIRFPNIVKVPNVPHYIKGIISLRESLMPIVDLRSKLNAGSDEITTTTRVVVVDTSGTLVGLTVDRVYEVIRIPRSAIFPPPPAVMNETGEKITGIVRLNEGKRIIMLMDPQDIIKQGLWEEIKSEQNVSESEITEVDQAGAGAEQQLVVLKLDGEQFGINIAQVREITKLAQITKVPRAPHFVQGVINLRGDVIPVVDLRKRFALDQMEDTDRTRIIVSEIQGKKVGLIVDEVVEVLRICSRQMEEVPSMLHDDSSQHCMGSIANIEDRMIMVLNLENILLPEELKQLDKVGESSKKKAPPKLKKQKE